MIADTREGYIESAKHNSLYWAEQAYNNGANLLMYQMLLQWAMGDELFGEIWDRNKERKNG